MKKISEIIWDLVSQDQLDTALQKLRLLMINSHSLTEVVVQSARHSDLMRQIRLGTYNFDQINMEKNKLRIAILEITEEFQKQIDKDHNETTKTAISTKDSIQQVHYGKGDNVAGDKIINKK